MSIENPRQEADTPRPAVDDADQPDGIDDDSFDLPDISRAAARVNEFLAWYGDGRLYPCVLPGTEDEMPPLFARDLQALTNVALAPPADAVKLGDVEALYNQMNAAYERETDAVVRAEKAERERDALRADFRAVLDEYRAPGPHDPVAALADLRAILDREPGREEPEEGSPSAIAAEELAALTRRTLGVELTDWQKEFAARAYAVDPATGKFVLRRLPAPGHVVEHQSEEPGRPARHVGRSWPPDHHIEDECPCPKAPCGLVSDDLVSPDCEHHPVGRMKTIRQAHPAENCPAAVVEHQPADSCKPCVDGGICKRPTADDCITLAMIGDEPRSAAPVAKETGEEADQ